MKSSVQIFREWIKSNNAALQILDNLPYSIAIIASDGTFVYINEAFCKDIGIEDPEKLMGNYNFAKDIHLLEATDMGRPVQAAISGKTTKGSNINASYAGSELAKYIKPEKLGALNIQDFYSFPLIGEDGKVKYTFGSCQTRQTYMQKRAITEVQMYIDNNWLEKFDMQKITEVAGLSQYHITRLFKQSIGKTPYDYYRHTKIEKLKEALARPDVKVSEAFGDCGIDYNSRYNKLFKEIVGMTPLEYQKTLSKN